MKQSTRRIAIAAMSTLGAVGVVLATPTIGAWYNTVISTGTINREINAHAHYAVPGSEEGFSAELSTEGPSNIIVQEVKFSPGGTTGWHTHPGLLLLGLAADSGPVDWYDSHCLKHVYSAGDSWTEGTSLHDLVNNSSTDAHITVTYVIAKGAAKRLDQAAPACAIPLGLK